MRERVVGLLVLIAAAGLTVPAVGQAASTASVGGGVLTVNGGAGADEPSISWGTAGGFRYSVVEDGAGANSGAGCTNIPPGGTAADVDPTITYCKETTPVSTINVSLAGGNDAPTITTCAATTNVALGEGANSLFAPDCPAGTFNITSGAGQDSVSVRDSSASTMLVTASLGGGDDRFVGGTGSSIVHGDAGNDVLVGTEDESGGPANDQFYGDDGNDALSGRAGNDRLDGGNGDDQLGRDSISSVDSGFQGERDAGADEFVGGPGSDLVDFYEDQGVTVSLNDAADDGQAGEGDNVHSDIESVFGSQRNDVLIGNAGPNTFDGGPGDDTISGGAGNDRLDGNGDADKVYGEDGDDFTQGGYGDDIVDGGSGVDSMFGDTGSCDAYSCAAYNDTLYSRDTSADSVQCGAGADRVQGDSSDIIAKDGFQACESLDIAALVTPPGPNQPASLLAISGKPTVKKGIKAKVTCAKACKYRVRVTLSAKLARKYRLTKKKRSVTIASASGTLKKAGAKSLTLKLTKSAKRRLGRVKKFTVTVTATVTYGKAKPISKKKTITIKR